MSYRTGSAMAPGVGVPLGSGVGVLLASVTGGGAPLLAGSGAATGAGTLRTTALPAGDGRADGVGVAAGSPKPGGRIDCGELWPSAGIPTPSAIAVTNASSGRSALEIRKRDNLLDMGQGLLVRAAGKQKHSADEHDDHDQKRKQRAGHWQTL
jgi:hypothetical protein